MAHGITNLMCNVRRRSYWVHQNKEGEHTPYVNRAKDRTLAGKARVRARKAARR